MPWLIDLEHLGDIDAIHEVHQQAFGRPREAQIIDFAKTAQLSFPT